MKQILWVEDDGQVRKAAERLCRMLGVPVRFSALGQVAKDLLTLPIYTETKKTFVAVVSDFDLGLRQGPTGADVLAEAERAGIPIRILCSSARHTSNDCPAATVFYDKVFMREMVEDVLVPLFREDTEESSGILIQKET